MSLALLFVVGLVGRHRTQHQGHAVDLFIKSEGKPGQAWHQDELFIPTRDRSLTAAWIALDDATVDLMWPYVRPDRQGGCLR